MKELILDRARRPAASARPGTGRELRGPALPARAQLPPDPALPLGLDDVDVWRASLDDQPAGTLALMQSLISADEFERARRFFFDRDRRRYVVGRGILRMLLGRYLHCAPQEIALTYGQYGKPALAQVGGGRALHFNIAHSEGLALYAFTYAGEVGVDVEKMRDLPDWAEVARSAFSPHEYALLLACPAERRRDEFFRAWTRQEAVLKALGTGLSGVAAQTSKKAFTVYPLDVGPGFAAALATSPQAKRSHAINDWTTGGLFPGGAPGVANAAAGSGPTTTQNHLS